MGAQRNAITLKGGKGGDIVMEYAQLKRAVKVLRSVNHKLRQKMIKLLEDKKRLTVTEIYVKLRLEQSVASQHLAILRDEGVVKTEREGKFVYYSLNKDRLAEISALINKMVS